MRLQRLTGLERTKLEEERRELAERIEQAKLELNNANTTRPKEGYEATVGLEVAEAGISPNCPARARASARIGMPSPAAERPSGGAGRGGSQPGDFAGLFAGADRARA